MSIKQMLAQFREAHPENETIWNEMYYGIKGGYLIYHADTDDLEPTERGHILYSFIGIIRKAIDPVTLRNMEPVGRA